VETKNRQKTLLIAAGLGLALLVGDSVIFSPLVASWKARSKTIADLRTKLSQGANMASRANQIDDRWDHMRTNTLPSNISTAEGQLLQSFYRWERASGLVRVSVKPQWKQTDDNYMTLECRADYTGDIEKLKRFLYEVEHDPLGVKIDDVEIASRDDNGRQLTLGVQISGLLLNPPTTGDQP
jgi:Tfp pilus assembly protein PilO